MATATLTNAYANLRRDAALDGTTDTRIYYLAIGTNNTAPSASDTQLHAEVFRKAITASEAGAAAGEGIFTLYLAPQEAIGVAIAEVGWFAGSSASAAANSGVLVARGLYSHTKTANESIVYPFDLTL